MTVISTRRSGEFIDNINRRSRRGLVEASALALAQRDDNVGLRGILGVRAPRFATPAELLELTGCVPGTGPPFGNLFGLPVLVDELLLEREESQRRSPGRPQ